VVSKSRSHAFVGVRTGPPELTPRPAESIFGVRTGSQASEIVPSRWTCRSQAFARVRRRPLCVAPAARRIGIRTPLTRLTNDPESARSFAANMRVVAKAVSPGVGIAPFVAEVLDADMDYVTPLPTMLQEMIHADSDVRVVVVGTDAWIWNRQREVTTTDWRQVDPCGEGFELIRDHGLKQQALALTVELGISMTVQDWLHTSAGPVFLESNAQSAWLFLERSATLVVPAIAKHLAGNR
jgi:hypothetical protein